MNVRSWMWDHEGEIMKVRSWRWDHEGGILNVRSWRWDHEGEILQGDHDEGDLEWLWRFRTLLVQLLDDQAVGDDDDDGGDDEDGDGHGPDPGWAEKGKRAGGEVRNSVVIPVRVAKCHVRILWISPCKKVSKIVQKQKSWMFYRGKCCSFKRFDILPLWFQADIKGTAWMRPSIQQEKMDSSAGHLLWIYF